MGQTKLMKKVV